MNLGLLDQDAPALFGDSGLGRWQRCLNLARQVLSGIDLHGISLLDVGCGRGGWCRHVAQQGAQSVVGLDIILEQVRWCRRVHPGVMFVQGDACALPFEDGTFDVVTSIESAAHYDDEDQFFRSAFRCLKRGGVFAVANIERDTIADVTDRLGRTGFRVRHCEDLTQRVLRSIDAWADVDEDMIRLGCDTELAARIRYAVTIDVRAVLGERGFRYLAWHAIKL